MKNFFEYLEERGIEAPEGNIVSQEWFAHHGFPMVVRCTCCGMTMPLPSAWVNNAGYTYCADCAGVEEE